jgi:putative tryptophan/tyrosine transport system substrate-binding protein
MGAFLVPSDPLLLGQVRSDMIAFALRHRLPAMYSAREYVEAGGVMSYAPNFTAMGERAAANVDETLKGANPADLPIERGTLQ